MRPQYAANSLSKCSPRFLFVLVERGDDLVLALDPDEIARLQIERSPFGVSPFSSLPSTNGKRRAAGDLQSRRQTAPAERLPLLTASISKP